MRRLLILSVLILVFASTAFAQVTQGVAVGTEVPGLASLAGNITKGLLYCVGVFLVIVSLFKRFGPDRISLPLEVEILGRKNLSPKTALLVVQVEGRRLLLASTPDDIKLISELDEPFANSSRTHKASLTLGAEERAYG